MAWSVGVWRRLRCSIVTAASWAFVAIASLSASEAKEKLDGPDEQAGHSGDDSEYGGGGGGRVRLDDVGADEEEEERSAEPA